MNNDCRCKFEPRPDRHSIRLRGDDYSQNGMIVIVGAGFKPAPTYPAPTGPVPIRAGLKPAPTNPAPTRVGLNPTPTKHGLPEIVRALKTFSARRINEMRNTPGVPIWQRNYYEHIIRNDESLHRIREYIVNNPAQWALDRENPLRAGFKPTPTAARNHNVSTDKDEPWQT